MQTAIKAIETRYKGHRFRSRLEARWAVFFDALGVEWEYEKEGYDLGELGYYLPDFWLPKWNCWIEVKGVQTDDAYEKAECLQLSQGKDVFLFGKIPDRGEEVENWGTWIMEKPKIELDKSLYSITEFLCGPEGSYLGKEVGCPVLHCGCTNTHITSARTNDNGRGNQGSAYVRMSCESNHEWDVVFSGHKGDVGIDIENVVELVSDFTLVLANLGRLKREAALTKARSARFEHGEQP